MRARAANRACLATCATWALLMLAPNSLAQSRPTGAQPIASGAPATRPARSQVPITFAKSGGKASVELAAAHAVYGEVVLRAFGRVWSPPVTARFQHIDDVPTWTAEFDAPAVRTPTVFAVARAKPADATADVLAELVVYPDRNLPWDKKTLLIGVRAPKWFSQWARAAGVPGQWFDGKTPATLPALRPDQRRLLIVGRSQAQAQYAEFRQRPWRRAFNILVLEAPWMPAEHAPLQLKPSNMRGPLAALNSWRWARPLEFSEFRAPNRIVCNRWAVVDTETRVPPLEVVGELSAEPWTMLSGIPWQEQLGRREQADDLLLEVLKAAAVFAPSIETRRKAVPVYPEKIVYDPRTMAYCPALACTTDDEKAADTARLLIADFRGPAPAPQDVPDRLSAAVKTLGPKDRLLLLGDDPALDRCEWLGLDREKKTIKRNDVIWLADDQPWDKTYEIPLMRKLTELGVPLAPPAQREKEK